MYNSSLTQNSIMTCWCRAKAFTWVYITILCTSFSLFSHAQGAEKKYMDWDYGSKNRGPVNWNKAPNSDVCLYGNDQSPIDIRKRNIKVNPKLPKLKIDYNDENINYLKKDYTVISTFSKSKLTYDDSQYSLYELRIHIPSEHLIYGTRYDIEFQLFHKNDLNETLVLSSLGKIGKQNRGLEVYTDYLSLLFDTPKNFVSSNMTVNPESFLPESKSYFTYVGSLTIPPCTQGIRYIVFENIVPISKIQIQKISKHISVNARSVQQSNRRKIEKKP